MSKKLRAGLVGLGMMGRHHLRVLSQLEGVDLVGVYDPAAETGSQINGVPVFTDLDHLLKVGLDYCVVAAPTIFHLELGLKLANAGVHTLIEKPVAPTHVEALQLVKAYSDANLIGGVGHIERFNPALRAMRQKIEEGLLGEIFQISTRRQGPFPARIADVGVVKDLATHDIDLTAWVAQQPFEWVQARTAHRSGREHEDLVAAVGQLADGTVTSHLVNWLTPFKQRETVITGERGAYVCDTLTADLTFYANGKVKKFLISVIDLMAAFPSLLFGFWGFIVFMSSAEYWAKLINKYLGFIPIFDVPAPVFERAPFIAGLVLAIMIIPIVTAITREIFDQTPLDRIQAAYALGATKLAMIKAVVIPFGRGGIIGGAMLGLGRAMGETVAVYTVLNIVYQINWQVLFGAGGNVASLILLKFGEAGPYEVDALMAAGLILFLLTLLVNAIADLLINRFGGKGR